jgi:hypothetical protein
MTTTFWLDKSKADHIAHLGKILKTEKNLILVEVVHDEYTLGVLFTSIFFAGVQYGLDKYSPKAFDKSNP